VLWVALNYFLQAFQMRSGEPLTMAVKAVFLVLSAIYLLALDRSGNTQLIWGLKGTAILLCGLWAGMLLSERSAVLREQEFEKLNVNNNIPSHKIQWQKFTPESFEAAKKSGRAILIDASADWCAVCKEIDEAVFEKPQGIAAMQNVVALSIDHSTGVDPAYIDMTTKMFGIKGLPYIQILAPGGRVVAVITGKDQLDTPDKLQEYLRMAGSTP
jgi:thiol:disulfide interchange protein